MQTLSAHLHAPAIVAGLLAGLVLVLFVVLFDLVAGPYPDGALPVLLKALVIYAPAGVITGGWVRRANMMDPSRHPIAPPAFHALATGSLLAVCHALVLLLTNAGLSPTLEWFVVEACAAAILSTVAGLLAGHLRL